MKHKMYNKTLKFKSATLRLFVVIVICCLGVYAPLKSSFLRFDVSSISFSEFTLTGVSPKIFSPDEGNRVRFTFENPNYLEVTIKIFDISGSEVKNRLAREADEDNIMFWNGTDNDNKFVAAGIYIYQAETSENVFNGTIIVVK